MKGIKLSLIATLVLGTCSFSNADSLKEALTNGKVSGEVAVTYETRKQDKELPIWNNYYSDTAYSVGSFALKYETGVWNNLSLTSKFRAYKTIFEGGKGEYRSYGYGDAAERFRETGKNKDVDLEEFYVKYQRENISLKAGRQFIASDWFAKTHNAVKLDMTFGDTALEAIYSEKIGRVYARDYRPMQEINGNKGAYKLGLSHKFNENIKATVYDVYLPDDHSKIGAKLNLKYNDYNFETHYVVKNNENSEDTDLLHLKASTNIAGVSATLGYIQVGDKAAFNGFGGAGEILSPFEEGDMVYYRDTKTYYASLYKSFGDLNATLLYGNFNYKYDTEKEYQSDEITLWLGYKVAKNIKANLGYTHFIADDADSTNSTDMDQLNATVVYSF